MDRRSRRSAAAPKLVAFMRSTDPAERARLADEMRALGFDVARVGGRWPTGIASGATRTLSHTEAPSSDAHSS
jgi:hypothetical protein